MFSTLMKDEEKSKKRQAPPEPLKKMAEQASKDLSELKASSKDIRRVALHCKSNLFTLCRSFRVLTDLSC